METILHVGAHRTASTTFQHFLDANAARLGQSGVACWTPARTRSGLFSGLVRRPQDITLSNERRAARATGLMRIEAERAARSGARALIVSDENMIGTVMNNLRERSFYPLLGERAMRFRPAFGDRCTKIILSIRAYEAFWTSSFAFAIQRGRKVPDARMIDQIVEQPRGWRDVVRDLAQSFPSAEVLVWPFERFAGRPEAQLAMAIGRPVAVAGFDGLRDRRNPSPSLDRLREIAELRPRQTSEGQLPAHGDHWMPFDAVQQAELAIAYQADLAWLRRGADGFATLIEDPADIGRLPQRTGATRPAGERAAAPYHGGHAYEGSGRKMV